MKFGGEDPVSVIENEYEEDEDDSEGAKLKARPDLVTTR